MTLREHDDTNDETDDAAVATLPPAPARSKPRARAKPAAKPRPKPDANGSAKPRTKSANGTSATVAPSKPKSTDGTRAKAVQSKPKSANGASAKAVQSKPKAANGASAKAAQSKPKPANGTAAKAPQSNPKHSTASAKAAQTKPKPAVGTSAKAAAKTPATKAPSKAGAPRTASKAPPQPQPQPQPAARSSAQAAPKPAQRPPSLAPPPPRARPARPNARSDEELVPILTPAARRARLVARQAAGPAAARRAAARRSAPPRAGRAKPRFAVLLAFVAVVAPSALLTIVVKASGPAVPISSADASFLSKQLITADSRVRARLVRLRDAGTAPALARTRDAILTTRSLGVEMRSFRGAGADRLRNALSVEREFLETAGSILANPRSTLRKQLAARDAVARRALAQLPTTRPPRGDGARHLLDYARVRAQATGASG
jgi:hypothetical protein